MKRRNRIHCLTEQSVALTGLRSKIPPYFRPSVQTSMCSLWLFITVRETKSEQHRFPMQNHVLSHFKSRFCLVSVPVQIFSRDLSGVEWVFISLLDELRKISQTNSHTAYLSQIYKPDGMRQRSASSFLLLIRMTWQQILSHERHMDACGPYARYILICLGCSYCLSCPADGYQTQLSCLHSFSSP